MVSGELIEEIERGARDVRGSSAPFGGLQLVLAGDFLQCVCIDPYFTLARACTVSRRHSGGLAGSDRYLVATCKMHAFACTVGSKHSGVFAGFEKSPHGLNA